MGAATKGSPTKSKRISTARSNVPIKDTCPSFRRGHLPSSQDVQRLRTLSLPHVGSFDYFLEHGLSAGVSDIVPLEIDLVQPSNSRNVTSNGVSATSTNVVTPNEREVDTLKMWLENIKIFKPAKTDYNASLLSSSSSKIGNRLIPRECRELGLMYSGAIHGEFCYQVNHRRVDKDGNMTEIMGNVCKISKKFGDMPIMVMSKACHLHDTKPNQLVKMREEVGFFVFLFYMYYLYCL
jgi:DNA-directed RNA polymerase I subunit RPA2